MIMKSNRKFKNKTATYHGFRYPERQGHRVKIGKRNGRSSSYEITFRDGLIHDCMTKYLKLI